jgi:hypothetical protein
LLLKDHTSKSLSWQAKFIEVIVEKRNERLAEISIDTGANCLEGLRANTFCRTMRIARNFFGGSRNQHCERHDESACAAFEIVFY